MDDQPTYDVGQIQQGYQDIDRQAQARDDRYLIDPFPFVLTGADQLRVKAVTSAGSMTITVCARVLSRKSEVRRHVFTVAPANDYLVHTFDFPIGDGYLLDVNARASATGVPGTDTWCGLELIVGLSGEKQQVTTLAQGYITPNAPIFGPYGTWQTPLSGPGNIRSVLVSNPAAGADWSQAVTTGARWLVTSLRAIFTASAAAANRVIHIGFNDAVNQYYDNVVATAITAGQAAQIIAAAGVQASFSATSLEAVLPLPTPALMSGSFHVFSSTNNIQAADQWSAIVLNVIEWLDN